MRTLKRVLTAFAVSVLLAACGGGSGGGGDVTPPPPSNVTLTISLSSDTPPARAIVGSDFQEVAVVCVTSDAASVNVPISSVSVTLTGDPEFLAALLVRLTNSGTPIGTEQPVIGTQAIFTGLSVDVVAGTPKCFHVETAVTGDVLWDVDELTVKAVASFSHGDIVPSGTSYNVSVVGNATSEPFYRERGRIVFPRGVQVDYGGEIGVHWSPGANIHIGDMETLQAVALTNNAGEPPFWYIRHGMALSPLSDRVVFTAVNADGYEPEAGVPYSVKTDGSGFVSQGPRVCPSIGTDRTSSYTPDGSFIIYATKCPHTDANGDPLWVYDIVAVSEDGSRTIRITDDTRNNISPVFINGTAYFLSGPGEASDPNQKYVLKAVGVDLIGGYPTETPRYITGNEWNWFAVPRGSQLKPTKGSDQKWLSSSPDGTELLITHKPNNGPDQMGIYDLASGVMKNIGKGSGASWAKDGRIVYFDPQCVDAEHSSGCDPVLGNDAPVALYFMGDDGSNVREVPMDACLRINWQSCASGLPLLPPA